MPSTLKNFIKVGMRNPYFIEIHIPKEQTMFTEWADDRKKSFKLRDSVTIKDFNESVQVDDIQ